ncbi:hypothetical protein BFW01_g9014 [Lasiodiplodia theobromae]|nr:hypothetical protein BFW01_g9014 [Lasiodiplodia theobromae]
MLLKSRTSVLPFGTLWLLLLFCLVLAPDTLSHALTSPDLAAPDLTSDALANVTKLVKKDVDHSCVISLCDLDGTLCEDADNTDGSDYDDDCDRDNLDDCPPAQFGSTGETAAERRLYKVPLSSGKTTSLTAMPYPSAGKVLKSKRGRLVYPYAMQPEDSDDCQNTFVVANTIKGSDPPKSTVTEHILELQTISRWMKEVSAGNLNTKVNDICFTDFWEERSLPRNISKMQSGAFKTSTVPNDRVFEAMGSFRNRGILLIADSQVNLVKARIWSGIDIIEGKRVDTLVNNVGLSDEDAGKAMSMILMPILVFDYLNNLQTRSRLYHTIDGVRDQLKLIENNIPQCSGLASSWDEFMPDFLEEMATDTAHWLDLTIQKILKKVKKVKDVSSNSPSDSDLKDRLQAVVAITGTLENAVSDKVKAPKRPRV